MARIYLGSSCFNNARNRHCKPLGQGDLEINICEKNTSFLVKVQLSFSVWKLFLQYSTWKDYIWDLLSLFRFLASPFFPYRCCFICCCGLLGTKNSTIVVLSWSAAAVHIIGIPNQLTSVLWFAFWIVNLPKYSYNGWDLQPLASQPEDANQIQGPGFIDCGPLF